MRCKGDENISLEIKVFKSFSTPREFRGGGGGGEDERNSPWRILVTASISSGFRG